MFGTNSTPWIPIVHSLATSIKARAYLCHATAVMLHGLAKLSPKMIYLNVEQSVKPSSHGSLTQNGINRAFSGKQRQSNLIYKCNGVSVIMISGKNTNRLGVEEIAGPASERLQVRDIPRSQCHDRLSCRRAALRGRPNT